jgi:hypothetical protein
MRSMTYDFPSQATGLTRARIKRSPRVYPGGSFHLQPTNAAVPPSRLRFGLVLAVATLPPPSGLVPVGR